MINVPEIFYPRFEHVNIFFSSPEYYTKCKHEELLNHHYQQQQQEKQKERMADDEKVQYGIKMDDFFPYSDRDHGFWTGYFTSRASLKRHERVASSFLLAARQIQTMPDIDGAPCDCDATTEAIYELEDALGVVQHHDGVSGTAKQHVANDYSKRLQKGINAAVAVSSAKLRRLLFGINATLDNLTLCQSLNETICDISQVRTTRSACVPHMGLVLCSTNTIMHNNMFVSPQAATLEPNKTSISVAVYNALAQPRSSPILLPVSSAGSYSIQVAGDSNSTETIVPSIPSPKFTRTGAASYVLPLDTGMIPALGAQVYQVTFLGDLSVVDDEEFNPDPIIQEKRILEDGKEDIEYSNGILTAVFDG